MSTTLRNSSRPRRVVTLTEMSLNPLSRSLASEIDSVCGRPDLIIGISTPGMEVARQIATQWQGIDVVGAKSHRSGTPFKRLAPVRWILRRLPRPVTDTLRVLESRFGSRPDAARTVTLPGAMPQLPQCPLLLIVDDAADSGATLLGAINALRAVYADARILTATIAVTRRDCACPPRFSALPPGLLVRFPWAPDA